MFSILTSVLISLGVVPATAKSDPCLMPSWSLRSSVAFACDFQDARGEVQKGLPMAYTGARTHRVFRAAPVGGKPDMVLIVSDRIVPTKDAPQEAALLGTWGGWVGDQGQVHGALGGWTVSLGAAGSSGKPVGTLVSLVYASAAR